MRVAIVNDSPMAVEALRRVVAGVPYLDLVWTAVDGAEAVAKCSENAPDLILMDLIMPVMDGVEATKKIMESSPCAILVVTASVGRNSARVYEAMGFGALDATKTPALQPDGVSEAHRALVEKIESIGQLLRIGPTKPRFTTGDQKLPPIAEDSFPQLLAIGASTGGTRAIEQVLLNLPADVPGTVIVQHMPEGFTATYAERLNRLCAMEVREARDGDIVAPGVALIAPGGEHMMLRRSGSRYSVQVKAGPPVSRHRPSVNVLFRSVAKHAARNAVGVILTGMGDDGAKGLLDMREAGAYTIAQDEESSVVWGMPRVAAELGAISDVRSLNEIPKAILGHLRAKQLASAGVE